MIVAISISTSCSTSVCPRRAGRRRLALRRLGWLVIAGAMSVVGCGGDEPQQDNSVLVPRLPAHVVEPPAGCPLPQFIPEGDAWMTGEVDADAAGALAIHSCADHDGMHWGGRHFKVRDVFIDDWKVSEVCYNICVQAGACAPKKWPKWDKPGVYPAVVAVQDAAQYCAWRGGRLPTALELVRASHGDVKHIANPALWDKTVACYGVNTPECRTLIDHTYGLQGPVGSVPEDVGPFGHHELFGNTKEMTGSFTDLNSGGFCDLPADAYEPVVMGSEDARLFFAGGEDALFEFPRKVSSLNYTIYQNPGTSEYRCAYDPEYVKE